MTPQAIAATEPLLALLAQRLATKAAEDKAVEARRAIDAQIAALLPLAGKTEGAVSAKLGECKITVTYGIRRKVDAEALKRDWLSLSDTTQAAFKWSADVATKAYKELQGTDLAEAVAFVTATPSLPSVAVEAIAKAQS